MKLRQHCHLTLLQRMYREAPRSSNSSQRHGTRMPTERKLCAPSSRCTTTTYRHTIQSSLMAMSDRRCAPSSSPCRRQISCRLIEEYFSKLYAPSSRCTSTTIPPYYTIVPSSNPCRRQSSRRIDGVCFWSTKCSRISIARWNVVLFAESVDVFVFQEAVRWGMRTVYRRRHRRHRRRAPALPRCRSLQLEPNQAIPLTDGTAKGRIPSLSP